MPIFDVTVNKSITPHYMKTPHNTKLDTRMSWIGLAILLTIASSIIFCINTYGIIDPAIAF